MFYRFQFEYFEIHFENFDRIEDVSAWSDINKLTDWPHKMCFTFPYYQKCRKNLFIFSPVHHLWSCPFTVTSYIFLSIVLLSPFRAVYCIFCTPFSLRFDVNVVVGQKKKKRNGINCFRAMSNAWSFWWNGRKPLKLKMAMAIPIESEKEFHQKCETDGIFPYSLGSLPIQTNAWKKLGFRWKYLLGIYIHYGVLCKPLWPSTVWVASTRVGSCVSFRKGQPSFNKIYFCHSSINKHLLEFLCKHTCVCANVSIHSQPFDKPFSLTLT